MNRNPVVFLVLGIALLCGSAALQSQETPAAVKDPIAPADCLKDKKKAPECHRLGTLYAKGEEVPLDEPRAIELLDAACRVGLASSCGVQGWLLLKRHERPEEVKKGEQLLERVCKQGNLGACGALGRAYASGTGVARDVPKAVKLLEKACDAIIVQFCAELSELLEVGGDGITTDRERAQALRIRGCELGDAPACQAACEFGSATSCVLFAVGLTQQQPVDATAAQATFRKACEAGTPEACHQLAAMTEDAARAITLWEDACARRYAPSCALAAHARYVGRGVAPSVEAAARLYAGACEGEDGAACATLGAIYARGELGADQTERGRAYLEKGCRKDVACLAIVASGRVPSAWGGNLDALRPRKEPRQVGPVRVGGLIAEPKKLRNVNPAYPAEARRTRVQGTVVLECVISQTGAVTDVTLVKGVPLLNAAAIEAVRQWRYTPTLLDGEPVPVIMTVTVNFTIG